MSEQQYSISGHPITDTRMKKTIRTADGKWLDINPDTDVNIIRQPRNVTRTGTDFAHGEDLYLTTDTHNVRHYYVISWVAEGRSTKESYRTLTEEQKDTFIRDHVHRAGKIGLDPDVADHIEKLFPGFLKRK
ncbi:hypothetical protein [Methanospirillum lacunae]|uniref:Uncharacterized protein n=2 Tax=Methanospirillum lacunae TaxID=668570 RepID=A0A2V2N676_9EURY|nr:hypothetical protein [Methanospirillum lacunae]PWR73236.1 hypothetical protein DK846_05275 [Methanospirillum lacunae]